MPTHHRNLRAGDSIWYPFQDRAHARGTSGAVVARSLMRAYSAGLLDDVIAPFVASDDPEHNDAGPRDTMPGEHPIPGIDDGPAPGE